MLKRILIAGSIGAALFIIVGIEVSLLTPLYANICKENPHTGHEDCTSYNLVLVICWHILESLNYYGVALTAVATVAIGWFTWTIWLTNKSQLAHARQVDRAYISCGPTRYLSDKEGDRTGIHLYVKNAGHTGGRVTCFGLGCCDPGKIPPDPQYKMFYRPGWFSPNMEDRPHCRFKISEVRDGPLPEGDILFYGRVHYLDIFKEKHSFGFIVSVNADGETHHNVTAPDAYTAWD
jgi:hypothetical protein